ncbi:MAG: hypothetical protein ACOYOD_11400 [Saprospiraceae bacterium]
MPDSLGPNGQPQNRRKEQAPPGSFCHGLLLSIRKGWKRRDLTPLNRYKDGSHCREVSIFRDGLAILTTKCRDFLSFIQYILAFFSAKNHRFCKNIQ